MDAYVQALCREMDVTASCPFGTGSTMDDVGTIYLGGGTPSYLGTARLQHILDALSLHYPIRPDVELTIEVNPEDVDADFVEHFAALHVTDTEGRTQPVTRVSMGVQSFHDEELRLLRRRHDAARALEAIRLWSQGVEAWKPQLSIDLIFGLPGQSLEAWDDNLRMASTLPLHHLSAYVLMYEEGTPLWHLLQQGTVEEADDDLSLNMYDHLIEATTQMGMEHYEVSNFARPGCRSRHNSSYWSGLPYLGLGAGAHGYDGHHTRYRNPDDLQAYLQGAKRLSEALDEREVYNEWVMCSLRRCEGLDLEATRQRFGQERYEYCLHMARKHLCSGRLMNENGSLHFSRSGWFVSDDIMSDLMAL